MKIVGIEERKVSTPEMLERVLEQPMIDFGILDANVEKLRAFGEYYLSQALDGSES